VLQRFLPLGSVLAELFKAEKSGAAAPYSKTWPQLYSHFALAFCSAPVLRRFEFRCPEAIRA
jgi:hypothetical protein